MRALDVLRTLRITRQTLAKYVKEGLIGVTILPNGRYDYNEHDVYALLNKGMRRNTYAYASIFKGEDRHQLGEQISEIEKYCLDKGISLDGIYKEENITEDMTSRQRLIKLLDKALDGNVENIIITSSDRIASGGIEIIKHLLRRLNCKLIILNDINVDEDLFDDRVIESIDFSISIKASDINNILRLFVTYESLFILNIDKDDVVFKNKPENITPLGWATKILLAGKPVTLLDVSNNRRYELTLDKLITGIKLNAIKRKHDCNLSNLTITMVDSIMQYAIFGNIVYR